MSQRAYILYQSQNTLTLYKYMEVADIEVLPKHEKYHCESSGRSCTSTRSISTSRRRRIERKGLDCGSQSAVHYDQLSFNCVTLQ